MMRYLYVCAYLVLLCACFSVVNTEIAGTVDTEAKKSPAKKANKDWNKINIRDIEKGWESGDEQDELEEEFDHIRKIQAMKQPKFDMNDGKSIQAAYKSDPFSFSGGGGQMVFIDLNDKQPNGAAWTDADEKLLSKKFAELMKSGSLPAVVYNIDPGRLLVNMEKPWQVKELLKFLAVQPEVKYFTVNNKQYSQEEWAERDEDEEL